MFFNYIENNKKGVRKMEIQNKRNKNNTLYIKIYGVWKKYDG